MRLYTLTLFVAVSDMMYNLTAQLVFIFDLGGFFFAVAAILYRPPPCECGSSYFMESGLDLYTDRLLGHLTARPGNYSSSQK